MQNSVPKGVGGMVAVLGSEIETIENFISENKINTNAILQMITLWVK